MNQFEEYLKPLRCTSHSHDVVLRLFPDASFVIPSLPSRHHRQTGSPIQKWSRPSSSEDFKKFHAALTFLRHLLHDVQRHYTVTVVLPTRLMVSQTFLEEIVSVLAKSGVRRVAFELPSNDVLLSQSTDQWSSLDVLTTEWSMLSHPSHPLAPLIQGMNRHSIVPFHILFSWATNLKLFEPFQSWMVVDTVVGSLMKDRSAGSHPVRDQENEKAMKNKENPYAKQRYMESVARTEPKPAPATSPFTIDIPSAEVCSMIINSISISKDGGDPLLSLSDLDRFTAPPPNPPPQQKKGSETQKEAASTTGDQPLYTSVYWSQIARLTTIADVKGVMSMPSFHCRQVERWVLEAEAYASLSLPFVRVVPPLLSASGLSNHRLLREGLRGSAVKEKGENCDFIQWLPADVQLELDAAMEVLPAEVKTRDHDEFFQPFTKIRSPRRGDVAILHDAENVVLKSVVEDGPFWLQSPSALSKRRVDDHIVQEEFRTRALEPKVKEMMAAGFPQQCEEEAGHSHEGSTCGEQAPTDTADGVLLCIQFPGLTKKTLEQSMRAFHLPSPL